MITQRLSDIFSSLGRALAARQTAWRLEQTLKRLEWQATFDTAHRLSETHTLPVRALRAELADLQRQRPERPRAETRPTFTASERCLN